MRSTGAAACEPCSAATAMNAGRTCMYCSISCLHGFPVLHANKLRQQFNCDLAVPHAPHRHCTSGHVSTLCLLVSRAWCCQAGRTDKVRHGLPWWSMPQQCTSEVSTNCVRPPPASPSRPAAAAAHCIVTSCMSPVHGYSTPTPLPHDKALRTPTCNLLELPATLLQQCCSQPWSR